MFEIYRNLYLLAEYYSPNSVRLIELYTRAPKINLYKIFYDYYHFITLKQNHWTKRSSKFGRKCVTYFSLASQRISTDIFWGTFTDIACKGNSCRVIILQITLLSRTGRTCCPNFDWWRNSMLILMLLNFWDVSRNLVNMEKYALIAQTAKTKSRFSA